MDVWCFSVVFFTFLVIVWPIICFNVVVVFFLLKEYTVPCNMTTSWILPTQTTSWWRTKQIALPRKRWRPWNNPGNGAWRQHLEYPHGRVRPVILGRHLGSRSKCNDPGLWSFGIIYLHSPWGNFPLFPLRNKSVHEVVNTVKLKLTSHGL